MKEIKEEREGGRQRERKKERKISKTQKTLFGILDPADSVLI